MRLLTLNLLAIALLLFGAASASAYSISMVATNYVESVDVLDTSDTVTIEVYFDSTHTGSDLMLLGVGVVFDDSVMSYDQAASSNPTYLFYPPPLKTAYMVAAPPDCATGHCGLFGLAPFNQVQLDFMSSLVASGNGVGANGPVELLATLVFHVVNPGGSVSIDFLFDSVRGSILQLEDGSTVDMNLGGLGSGIVIHTIPEPTTALLIGLGLVGLGVAGRRRE